MLDDAQKTIFELIVNSKEIEGSVNFTKDGLISVKFVKEKKRIKFKNLLFALEMIEIYEQRKK